MFSQQDTTAVNSSGNSIDLRQRKIVEFMLELRKLFALMVASQRKYVDPTRAVDILRAAFFGGSAVGGGGSGSNSGTLMTNGGIGEKRIPWPLLFQSVCSVLTHK